MQALINSQINRFHDPNKAKTEIGAELRKTRRREHKENRGQIDRLLKTDEAVSYIQQREGKLDTVERGKVR